MNLNGIENVQAIKKNEELAEKSFVTNDCTAQQVYKLLDKEYNTPFIGMYILSDEHFLKFCTNYTHYMKQPLILAESKLFAANRPKNFQYDYPVTFLDDIEVHWVHDGDPAAVLREFERRRERALKRKPFFFWSDQQLHQSHSEEERQKLITTFLQSIPPSQRAYFTVDQGPSWKGCSMDNRSPYTDYGQGGFVTWAGQLYLADVLMAHLNNQSPP